jgi:4-hydroxybenzoate polyprenyltransferase
MPFLLSNADPRQTVFVFVQRFLFIFVLLIPFEIKDMKADSKTIMTIPLVLGIKPTKIIGYLCLLIFVFISFFENQQPITSFFIGMITACFLFFSTSDRNKYFSIFWVESIPIYWYLLLVCSQP